MAILNPTNFIQTVFIHELEDIVNRHPYHAFMIMSTGIEFLGKCLKTDRPNWHNTGKSSETFEKAIQEIPPLQKYEELLEELNLYGGLRCGLLHSAQPDSGITLSSKNERAHLERHIILGRDCINLRCEDFYADFKEACEWVIASISPEEPEDKMNKPFLFVPGDGSIDPTGFANSSASAYLGNGASWL
ncbi:MAG: hypothetical protein SFV55_19275 [Haliscomenobacter sp.]|uniref:hypothetical protein n=1 Tax=Haliscomenobacter sp. TaxID=2717303 RepID=UPI0029A5D39F|nr:hypothetical protein [Haliscomenobacter sp.]MDX2070578.1 hypothetical protein [Haliscomenobacter sp.]